MIYLIGFFYVIVACWVYSYALSRWYQYEDMKTTADDYGLAVICGIIWPFLLVMWIGSLSFRWVEKPAKKRD